MTDPDTAPTIDTLLARRAWVRGIARSLVADESRVDDVEQETWIAAIESPPSKSGAISTWLRRVVTSRAVDAHRAESRRAAREVASARPERVPSTETLVAKAEIQRDIAAAVCSLEEPYRTAVLLRYFEEMQPRDVAARLAVPVETVRTRLKRAHEMLRARLDGEYGGDRRAWCALLLPLLSPKRDVPVGTAVGGVLLMAGTKKMLAIAAAALLLLGGGAAWMAARESGGDPAITRTSDAAVAAKPAPDSTEPVAARIRLTGRVRDKSSGRPVAAARIVFEGEAGKRRGSAASADDGRFESDGVAATSVRVEADGFREFAAAVPVPAAGVADLGDLWIEPATAFVVEVFGPDGAHVEGADVAFVRTAQHGEVMTTNSYLRSLADPDFKLVRLGSQRTDAAGLARFAGIAAGQHELSVRANGFAAASAYADVRAGRRETRKVVRLVRGVTLSGRVVTAAGAPAPGWLVSSGGPSWDEASFAKTDDAGRFTLDSLSPGEVQVSAGRRRGQLPVLATIRVPEIPTVELRLPPFGSLAGRVHLADGTAVADAEVGLQTTITGRQNAGFYARTDADGRFRFDEVPAGPITRFEVRHAGLYQKSVEGATHVDAVAEATKDVTLAPGSRLHGRVLSPDGPVGGAQVLVNYKSMRSGQGWETAVADAEGRYSFDFLRPGPAGVVPSHAAYAHPDAPEELWPAIASGKLAAALTLDLPEGGDVERDLQMLPGTRVSGRVVGPAGEPVPGVVVVIDPPRFRHVASAAATTDASGAFVLERVAGPGSSTLRAEADGMSQVDAIAVDLIPGGRIDGLEVKLAARPAVAAPSADVAPPAAVTVIGRAQFDDGAAVAGARIAVFGASGARRYTHGELILADQRLQVSGPRKVDAVADDRGGFRLTLAPGEHLLVVSGTDAVEEVNVVRVPAAGDVVVTLKRGATLSGTMRGDDGKPLAHASVVLEPSPDLASERFAGRGVDPMDTDGGEGMLARHTAADGTFAFPGVPDADYALVVILRDKSPQRARHVRFGPLRPSGGPYDLSLAAPLTGVIAGRVVDPDGAVYRDARIQMHVAVEWLPSMWGAPLGSDSRLIECGPDGSFRIEGVTSPRYTVHVWLGTELQTQPDGQVVSRKLRRRSFRGVRPGQSDLVLRMTEGLTIRGRLLDESGTPLPGWMVEAGPPGYDRTILSHAGLSDASGAFEIGDLDDVEYRMRPYCDKPQHRRLVLPGLVRGGAEIGDVVATLEGRIRGHVVDASGAPVPGTKDSAVRVVATTGGAVQQVPLDAQGAFEATGLEPGKDQRIRFVTSDTASSSPLEGGVVVPVGTEDVTIVAK